MSSFCAFFLSCYRRAVADGSKREAEIVDRIYACLEELSTDPNIEIQNLVQVGFMEAMWKASAEEYNVIKNHLGPASRQFLIATESY